MEETKTIGIKVAGAKLRAKERVFAYLEEEFNREEYPRGARLPTSRALAKQLGVSVSTVQTVFRTLADKGVISTEVGNGSFLVNPPRKDRKLLRIGLTFGAQEGSNSHDRWQLGISDAILKHAGSVAEDISVVPINLAQPSTEESFRVLESYRDRVDGIILKPNPELAARCMETKSWQVPTVHLNPPNSSATSDFVSVDYLSGFLRVGEAFMRSGRRHILYVDNFDLRLGPAGLLRNGGLVGAIGSRIGKEVQYEIISPGGSIEDSGYAVARKAFTAGTSRPDAIVCTGDFLAVGVMKYCAENGIRVPEDVSIIGGTGSSMALAMVGITQVCQPIGQIGKELVEMVCRIRSERRSQIGIFLPISFTGGKSTTQKENQALKVVPEESASLYTF